MGRLPDQPGQAGSRRVAMAQFRCWVLQARISNLLHGILHWAPPAQLGMQYVYCSVPPSVHSAVWEGCLISLDRRVLGG